MVLVTGAMADMESDFAAALEKMHSKKEDVVTPETKKTEVISPATNSIPPALCTDLGEKTVQYQDLIFHNAKTATFSHTTQLMLDQLAENMSYDVAVKKIVEALKMKTSGSGFKKISLKKRSTKKAESFIKDKIAADKIIDHWGGGFAENTYSAADFYLKAYKFLNAYDYPAKNDAELKKEIVHRNVLMHVFFAQETRFKRPSNPSAGMSEAEAIKSFIANGGQTDNYPAYVFGQGFRADNCDENMNKIGPDDLFTPYVMALHASKHNLRQLGYLIGDDRASEIVGNVEQRVVVKWKNDRQRDPAAMVDAVMDELKKERIIN